MIFRAQWNHDEYVFVQVYFQYTQMPMLYEYKAVYFLGVQSYAKEQDQTISSIHVNNHIVYMTINVTSCCYFSTYFSWNFK